MYVPIIFTCDVLFTEELFACDDGNTDDAIIPPTPPKNRVIIIA